MASPRASGRAGGAAAPNPAVPGFSTAGGRADVRDLERPCSPRSNSVNRFLRGTNCAESRWSSGARTRAGMPATGMRTVDGQGVGRQWVSRTHSFLARSGGCRGGGRSSLLLARQIVETDRTGPHRKLGSGLVHHSADGLRPAEAAVGSAGRNGSTGLPSATARVALKRNGGRAGRYQRKLRSLRSAQRGTVPVGAQISMINDQCPTSGRGRPAGTPGP